MLATFMTPLPKPIDPFLNMVYPFSKALWGSLVAVVLLVAATVWLLYATYVRMGDQYPYKIK